MSDRTLTRAAVARPSSVDETARTVELTITGERDPGDGIILSTRQLPERGPAPVPVLLSHENNVRAMAGRIESLRVENGELIGLARFDNAPAAEEGFQLARAGVGVSVGASYRPDDLQPSRDGRSDVAVRWRLREVSLTPVPADPYALVRSAPQTNLQPLDPMSDASVTITEPTDLQDSAVERAAERCELAIRRSAAEAGLPADVVDQLVRENRNKNKTDAVIAVVREHTRRVEAAAPVYAGHPARVAAPGPSELQTAFERALSGQALDRPLVELLRQHGYTGKRPADVMRDALTGGRPESWLRRGFHSSDDAKSLFLETGDRRLQERYAEPPRGIMELARIRELSDFRSAKIVDCGLVGSASKLIEGAELQFKTINDSAGEYKPSRYGLGLSVSFEALASDDLGGLDQVLLEASATLLEAEANALVQLLTASPDGALAPDGAALFASARGNSVPADLDISGLALAVKTLRGAKSVGNRNLWLQPGWLLVGPEQETRAAQLLTEVWAAETPDDTNPWKLRLIVEPTITDSSFYVVADGPRRPFELGRVSGLPRFIQEEDFSTSSMRFKIEGAFGVAVADPRVIVRCVEPQS